MKLKLYIVFLCMKLIVLPLYVSGQGVIISSGIYMHLSDGTMVLHGNWVNDGNYADTLGIVILNDTAQQDIGGSSSTQFSNLTINNLKGVIGSQDFGIEGILYLESANASDSTGTLDMGANTLTMDSSATTFGAGDVTGIVRRLFFTFYKAYSFGNQFSTISFAPGGTYPSEMQVKISIGTSPSWMPTAITRMYDCVQTGGSNCFATVTYHYLDSELNGNNENELVHWTNGTPGPPLGLNEFGRSNFNITNNWVAIGNIDIGYFPTSFGVLESTLSLSVLVSYIWNGSQSTSWTGLPNWTPNGVPSAITGVIIPDASTTTYSPILPDSAEIKTLIIQPYGILNSVANAHFEIYGSNGAWNDAGTFNSSTSNVIFIDALATIAGTTNFYNITIDSGASLRVTSGNIMRIAGSMNNKGIWHAVIEDSITFVEYNGGDQTVVIPNPATSRYNNLILSGSGTKTMPDTTLNINRDFSMSGTARATAIAALNINGNFTIGSGATFNTGAYNHSIAGNFVNNNAFNSTSGNTVTFNGISAQTLSGAGATTFNDLIIDNGQNVTINSNALTTVSDTLLINSGKKLSVAAGKKLSVEGTITNNAGASRFILLSNSAGTASLLHNTDNVQATVKRYISGTAEEWHFISSPVAAQNITGTWLPSGTYGNGTGYDLYLWNEPNSCWIYKLNTTSTINWNTVHPGSGFTPGRGYLYSVQANHPTKTFAGNLNNGSLDYPLTFSSSDAGLKGFNFVGNPYPSSIDWQAASGWTRSILVNSGGGYDMWIWNPAANNYGVCNSATGICTNSVTRYVPSMQGFFVQASADGDLGMDNALRLHDSGTWFKKTDANPDIFSMVLRSEADSSFDEALLLFGYSENQPGALKLFSSTASAPGLFLSSGEKFYSVLYLTDTTDNPTVPVSFKPGTDGNYSLNCNFDPDKYNKVELEDHLTNSIQMLISGKAYNFQASRSDDANRFVLHFGIVKDLSRYEIPARIYSDGIELIIDLAMVSDETEVLIYDALGRLLMEKPLQGLLLHRLSLHAKSQILIVHLKNTNGYLSRKIIYSDKLK